VRKSAEREIKDLRKSERFWHIFDISTFSIYNEEPDTPSSRR